MKYINIKNFLTIILYVIYGCNPKSDIAKTVEVVKESNKIEITPLFINEVSINDTTEKKLEGYGSFTNGSWHPSESQIGYKGRNTRISEKQIMQILQSLIYGKEAKVYLDLDSNRLAKEQIFAFVNSCDSIATFDDNGKEISREFYCDSISMSYSIQKIIFYESWFLHPNNGSIEKEVLGYTLCRTLLNNDNPRDKGNKLVVHVFNSEAGLQKTKKHLYFKQNKLK